MSFSPKVSVVIPVYNGSNYLKEAIDSALAQTYKNIEVLVINDGSKDDGKTEAIAKSYGDKIRYFKKENGGVATALNLGIEKMTGEYFSWLSHDDMYKPGKIKKQVAFLNTLKNREVVLFSNYELINEYGRHIGNIVHDHDLLKKAPEYALLRGLVNGITMLIPKKVFESHGNFNVSLWCTQDYDMWHRIFDEYEFIHLPLILSKTRVHSLQDTTSNPRVVTEGNVLWQKMIEDTTDERKIAIEGDLFSFYLKMTQFLSYTPYYEAQRYSSDCLEHAAKLEETSNVFAKDTAKLGEAISVMSAISEKKATAYLLANVARTFISTKQTVAAKSLIFEQLVGAGTNLESADATKPYLDIISANSKKPRLLFCSGHWLTGGMERVLSIVFEQLKDQYDLFLITPYDGRVGTITLPNYVRHIRISNDYFYSRFSTIALTFSIMLDIRVVTGIMNLWSGQLELYGLCHEAGIKTVASNHEMFFYPYVNPDFHYLVHKRAEVFASVDAVLWPTNFSTSSYRLIAKNGYLMPNPNSYKISKIVHKPEPNTILCVGRFNDYVKRIDRILECFVKVQKKIPQAKLILVGSCNRYAPYNPNSKETIDELLKKLSINENTIDFVGEVGNVDAYYKKASLLLLTSNNEGFGMVISEAACHGVPAVCSSSPGLEDLVENGKSGYLVDGSDINKMADTVVGILSSNKLRRELSEGAKEVAKQFEASLIGGRWKYMYEAIIGDKTEELSSIMPAKQTDSATLCNQLFIEMNNMVSANLQREKARGIGRPKFLSLMRHAPILVYRSVRARGLKETGWIIATKVLGRLRR